MVSHDNDATQTNRKKFRSLLLNLSISNLQDAFNALERLWTHWRKIVRKCETNMISFLQLSIFFSYHYCPGLLMELTFVYRRPRLSGKHLVQSIGCGVLLWALLPEKIFCFFLT